MKRVKVMTIFGTRPEAIKMAPLVAELRSRPALQAVCCVTAQHRQMLDSVLEIFRLAPDYDLNIMEARQTLSTITSKCLTGMDEAIDALCEMNPAYFEYVIEAGTYANQDEDIKTVAVANYIYCRADLDDTTVQVFLDAIFSNIDELALAHSAVENITADTAVSGLTVPLHPAAEAYYKAVGIIN